MFLFLSKKIAIPNGVQLRCVDWNLERRWLAVGGDGALLKVVQLESTPESSAGASGIAMNQALGGHQGYVKLVSWNHQKDRLASSDMRGLIIVWSISQQGVWYEEMVNHRQRSAVTAMNWSGDGRKICITYEDGHVIVGTVGGERLWGKDIKLPLSLVCWSPDGCWLLFGTSGGQAYVYDENGSFVSQIQIVCIGDPRVSPTLAGIAWYEGFESYPSTDARTLVIAFEDGRMQFMFDPYDNAPLSVDAGIRIRRIRWSPDGSVLAAAGTSVASDEQGGTTKETGTVQLFSSSGQHIRTLKVPGDGVTDFAWEKGSLRLVMAVESSLFFASVRQGYRWGYFGKTIVYGFRRPDSMDEYIMFWDTKLQEKIIKCVTKLHSVCCKGEFCALLTRPDEQTGQYVLALCNGIGTVLRSKFVDADPVCMAMNESVVVVTSNDGVWVWRHGRGDNQGNREDGQPGETFFSTRSTAKPAQVDPICSVALSDKCLVIALGSGTLLQHDAHEFKLERTHKLRSKPQEMKLNCDSTRLAIIDVNGVLSFFDLAKGEALSLERRDVWNMEWSEDIFDHIAFMEKNRQYVFRGLSPEEPITSSGYLCKFKNLTITSVLLDEVMKSPDNPSDDVITRYETRTLRDTRGMCAKEDVSPVDVMSFIEENAHPRLWRILAETALSKIDLATAEKAFVRCSNYHGVQFLKRLRKIDDPTIQQAEVLAYFKKFDEAERVYQSLDRLDLIIELRVRVGDWFGVLERLKTASGFDDLRRTAYNHVGDYFADRQQWSKAIEFYEKSRNHERIARCAYALEDYARLETLVMVLPESSPLLPTIGEMLSSVGLCDESIKAFVKSGNVKAAIDSAVYLNQWDRAIELAEEHKLGQIEGLLTKYASHLLQQEQSFQAIELYRKAGRHNDVSKLLMKLAHRAAETRVRPLRAKKFFVLAAIEIDRHRRKAVEVPAAAASKGTYHTTSKALVDGLLSMETSVSKHERPQDNPWRGAEAFHFFLLAQRHYHANNMMDALCTALRLEEFDDILDPKPVHCLIALTSFRTGLYEMCSRSFSRLEQMEGTSPEFQAAVQDLAVEIFMRHPPVDPPSKKNWCTNPTCDQAIPEWAPACSSCGTRFPASVASGKSLLSGETFTCTQCRHSAYISEMSGRVSCPLCHKGVK